MKTNTILRDEVGRRKIDAMARVFAKSNRVLTGLPIYCTVDDDISISAPSWTDGTTITFNLAVIGSVSTIEDIIRLTGLDLHEVAHVLYTLRRGDMVDEIRRDGMTGAYNMLEDQRIETLLTAKYPSAVAYLVSTFMRFCLMHEESWEANFPLMHGRYYLPKDVRAEFKRRFKRQDLIPTFIDIIDEYRKMVLPLDSDRALELVRAYHGLLVEMSSSGLTPESPTGCGGHGRPVDVGTGRPTSEKEQQEASDLSDVYDDAFNDEDADSDPATGSERDDNADPSTNAPANPDGDDDAEADDSDGGTGSDGDADSGGDSDSDSDGDSDNAGDSGLTGEGTGDGIGSTARDNVPDPEPLDDDAVREMLEDFAKAYEELDEVQEDAVNKQKAIVRGDGEITTRLPAGRYRDRPVDADSLQAVRGFSKELDRLRADSDPGWASHRASGRINVKRAIHGAPLTELWDEWDAGHNDACDIEAVIIIDDSGSMSGAEIEQASRAMWVIKRSLEKVEASVTVLTFGEASTVVYGRREKASRSTYKDITANGRCTHPREATIEAVRILTSTRRTNRIFIAITDGKWDNEPTDFTSHLQVSGLIKAMGDRGITTALAHIGRWGKDAHGCHVATSVNHASDLTGFAKSIVAQSIIQKGK